MPYALSRTDGLDRMHVLHHCRYFASMMMVMDRARIVSAYTVLFSGTLCTSTPEHGHCVYGVIRLAGQVSRKKFLHVDFLAQGSSVNRGPNVATSISRCPRNLHGHLRRCQPLPPCTR